MKRIIKITKVNFTTFSRIPSIKIHINTERCEKDYKKIFLFINNNWRFFLLFSQYYGRYQIFCNGSKALLFASSIMYSVYFPNSLTAGRVTPLSSNPITGKEKKKKKKRSSPVGVAFVYVLKERWEHQKQSPILILSYLPPSG